MIQSIYTSVSNADIVPCGKKGQHISSDPIPLLRNNYLGEYRTELEKAKVRKNLGIADDQSLLWGSLEGHIEDQKDLVDYIEGKWEYHHAISEDINTVAEALDYVIFFVNNFKSDNESITQLKDDVVRIDKNIEDINTLIDTTKKALQESIDDNADDIEALEKAIEETNNAIEELNKNLGSINVDNNILSWIKNSVSGSDTIALEEDTTLKVIISQVQDNAIIVNGGLYVKDYSKEIEKIETLESNIKVNSEAIESLKTNNTYQTELTPDTSTPTTVGGITQGTKVSDLKDKSITEILDIMLFPTYVRPLIYPSLSYSPIVDLVEVGSVITKPELVFIKGDAGEEISREDKLINPTGLEVSSETYDLFGVYNYQGKVFYGEGQELLDNKNQPSGQKIPEGSLDATFAVTTTYPWYTSSKNGDKPETKQQLVRFGINGEIEFSLSGQAQVWLPGSNSTMQSFTVNIGLGEYLNVDMNGWSEPTIIPYNGINYKVWTKKDTYSAILSHKIKFTLAL